MSTDRVCMKSIVSGKAYCGRKPGTTVLAWTLVTCSDCLAAHRADEAANR